MRIKEYISVALVLAVGIFLVDASLPTVTFAAVQASTGSNSVQCTAPVTSYCVPATAGPGVAGTFCANVPVQAGPANQVITPARAFGETIGSILAAPIVVTQCILGLGDCP